MSEITAITKIKDDWILIREHQYPERTSKGIFLPEKRRSHKPNAGIVVGIGPGKLTKSKDSRIRPSVKLGDRIIYDKYMDIKYYFKSRNYTFLKERNLYVKMVTEKETIMFEPTRGKVIISRDDSEDCFDGTDIFKTDWAEERTRPLTGTIVSVGPPDITITGVSVRPQITAGMKVLFSPHAGTKVTHAGVEYLIMEENQIFCVVETS